ncbi:MAG TPA: hypothetical protein VI357_19185 [Mycobacteriales bacterium]
MTENQPDGTAAHERSGADVVEGVETAAAGTPHDGVLRPPEESKARTAPVEQVRDDPAMTEGQVVGQREEEAAEVPETRVPEAPLSGGAQTIAGGRISDRVSAADTDDGGEADR